MSNRISIIIPTLNEEDYIENILHDLHFQTYAPHEIVVVDGSSQDATILKVTQFHKVRLIRTRPQVAHQRHLGATKTTGDILVFLDADTRIKRHFLQNVQKTFSSSDIAFACPSYIPLQPHLPSTFLYMFFNSVFFMVQKLMPCGAGSCIIVRRKTYIDSGGFEKQYTYDDMQFLSKAKQFGKFAFIREIVYVSNRRIRKLGFLKAFVLYLRLSWYFIRNDYRGANSITYPFAFYKE